MEGHLTKSTDGQANNVCTKMAPGHCYSSYCTVEKIKQLKTSPNNGPEHLRSFGKAD